MTTSPPPIPERTVLERSRSRWPRRMFVGFIIIVGLCQALSTTPSFDIDLLPNWLGGAIAIIGFLTFLVLVGFFGNFLAAIVLFVVSWRGWHWPLWRAALLALPFAYVTYQVMPKPWQGP